MSEVRALQASDVEPTIALLVAAFRADPGYTSLFGPAHLDAALAFLLSRLVAMRVEAGAQIWVTGGDTPVGMLSCAPSDLSFGLWTYLRHGLWSLPLRFGFGPTRRMLAADAEVGELRTAYKPQGPYLWISQVGVDPAHQGQGHGGRLVRHALAYAAALGQPVALMTTERSNLAFYRRFDFEVLGECTVSTGFTTWFLLRPAP